MTRRAIFGFALGWTMVAGCGDLHLVDRLDPSNQDDLGGSSSAGGAQSGGSSGTLGGTHAGGVDRTVFGGSSNTSGTSNGGGSNAFGGAIPEPNGGQGTSLAGAGSGGITLGGAANDVGGSSLGGIGGQSGGTSGGNAAGGAITSSGGRADGGTVGLGGSHSGGALSAGASSTAPDAGGTASGGTSAAGSNGDTRTAGSPGTAGGGSAGVVMTASGGIAAGGTGAAGGTTGSGGTSAGGSNVCPAPITKSAALYAAEPTPADPCARVAHVIRLDSTNYAFGYTNGEIYLFNAQSKSSYRRDSWSRSGTPILQPRAPVAAMVAPRLNTGWSFVAAYTTDMAGGTYAPQFANPQGQWIAASVVETGITVGLVNCPFHAGAMLHVEWSVPWISQAGSVTYLSKDSTGTLPTHLGLTSGSDISAIETVTTANGWFVVAGTRGGELYRTNLLTQNLSWNDTTQSLDGRVTWNRITGAGMPAAWVTDIAVHPERPDQMLVVFARWWDTDAVWYTGDGGLTWSNRHGTLPTGSDPAIAPSMIGASFNPYLEGAAYVVTAHTAFFTEDYAEHWSEW